MAPQALWWNGRFAGIIDDTTPPPAPMPERYRPYGDVLAALRQCTPDERIDFYESVSALERAESLDDTFGLLQVRSGYCQSTGPLERALRAEWRRRFMTPHVRHRVERQLQDRLSEPDLPLRAAPRVTAPYVAPDRTMAFRS